jgi:hypothetical protein
MSSKSHELLIRQEGKDYARLNKKIEQLIDFVKENEKDAKSWPTLLKSQALFFAGGVARRVRHAASLLASSSSVSGTIRALRRGVAPWSKWTEDFQSSVEDTEASWLVARAIEKTGARGVSVAAPAK